MPLSRRLIATVAWLAFTSAPAEGQTLPTRLNIDLVYARGNNPALEQHVRDWVSALQDKVQTTLAWDTSLQLAAAGRIQVSPAPQPILPTANVIEQRWTGRNAIQIVVGHGRREADVSTFQGSIFLGGLRGRLPVAIPISQPIAGGSYERASNFVIVVALYALSVDAARRPVTSCRLLQRAAVLAGALPPTLTSVDAVKGGIRADLQARCRGARV